MIIYKAIINLGKTFRKDKAPYKFDVDSKDN